MMRPTPDKTVLVTGVDGFIGAHIANELAELDYSVIGTFLEAPSEPVEAWWSTNRHRMITVPLDVSDKGAAQSILAMYQPASVIHAAAVTDPSTGSLLTVNFEGAKNILGPARPAAKVFVSSASVYTAAPPDGKDTPDRIDEEAPVVPVPARHADWTYAQSKRAAELWALAHGHIRIARVAACFGPLERPTQNRTVMSIGHAAARAALESKRVEIESGVESDLTYVRDTARGIIALLEADSPSSIVNIARSSVICGDCISRAANSAILGSPVDTVYLSLDTHRRPLNTQRLEAIRRDRDYELVPAFEEYVRWLSAHEY